MRQHGQQSRGIRLAVRAQLRDQDGEHAVALATRAPLVIVGCQKVRRRSGTAESGVSPAPASTGQPRKTLAGSAVLAPLNRK